MFWILRRTGAVNFFNSLNNNCSTSKGNNNNTNDKYVKRPPRKAYGRLSAHDSDDNASFKQKIDDPFDEVDNFEMITSAGKTKKNSNMNCNIGLKVTTTPTTTATTTTTIHRNCMHNNHHHHAHDDGDCGDVEFNIGKDSFGESSSNSCHVADCQGNFLNNDAAAHDKCNGRTVAAAAVAGGLASDIEDNCNLDKENHKEVYQNTINRLHAMALSDDDDDYDEALTCNVCDRAFSGHRQLASHQQKKRHFCCSACDSLFPSLMLLEHHKEEFEHWDDEEIHRRICCRHNRSDDFFTDTDSFTSDAESEDLERLL